MKFSEMQARHELLLEAQEKKELTTDMALDYITDARREENSFSLEEIEMVRANLRYWASYVFEQTSDYPDTQLRTVAQTSQIMIILKNIGIILSIILFVVLFVLGLAQIPKILTISQNPETASEPTQIIIYDSGGVFFIVAFVFFAIVVIALQIIFFRKQTAMFMAGIGQRVTELINNVRYTLVGGVARVKPLATLRVIEGPQAMIGQKLEIYTEVVKLGRDPKRAEITFYEPDTNSSVSGLHARIEFVNRTWRIVALSVSGSETFVNDTAIPFAEPYPLESGQLVRLGYAAQKPVTFEFNVLVIATSSIRKTEADYRKTDVGDTVMPVKFSKVPEKKLQTQGSDDDIFNEFRDR
jgi:hypothetical protein